MKNTSVPKYFVVESLEQGWKWEDFELNAVEWDYCLEALDIPEEHLKNVYYENESLEIELCDVEDVSTDDWFVQLYRKATYADECA